MMKWNMHDYYFHTADGSCTVWRVDNITAPVSKLTGPDVDHITNIQVSGNKIYTSCRDGCVRIYSLDDIHSWDQINQLLEIQHLEF